MSTQAMAIYEKGVLRLLTPVSLPERARVRVQILAEEETRDDLFRAEAALTAKGLINPANVPSEFRSVSQARRAELACLYASGGPLSELIIAERGAR